jgi:hypothetical protein
MQIESAVVDECLRSLQLLAREGRLSEAWEAALLDYLQDVGSSSRRAGGSEAGSGAHSGAGSNVTSHGSGNPSTDCAAPGSTHALLSCRLTSLGALPLTALVPCTRCAAGWWATASRMLPI